MMKLFHHTLQLIANDQSISPCFTIEMQDVWTGQTDGRTDGQRNGEETKSPLRLAGWGLKRPRIFVSNLEFY